MKRILVALVLASPLVPAAARADLRSVVLDGHLHTSAGERGAKLHFLCDPNLNGGAVSVELWVPQAFKLKDFDYDDFEGPDAAASSRALSRVSVSGDGAATEIDYAAAGWYSGEDPDTFVFGLSQRSHRRGNIATLLDAVDSKHTHFVWSQRGFDDPERELRATFGLDAAAVKRIRDAVDPCLAPRPKPKKK